MCSSAVVLLTGFCFDFVHLSEQRHLSIHETEHRAEPVRDEPVSLKVGINVLYR